MRQIVARAGRSTRVWCAHRGMHVFAPSKAAVLVVALTAISCLPDPIHVQDVDALGGEAPGVPPGPLHRPGQPCGACHGPDGPATTQFTLAGTVYQSPGRPDPLTNATVRFIDWTGAQFATTTNCAGNFFVSGKDFNPTWPVWTKVQALGQTAEMISAAFRETSCNNCHADPADPAAVGHVYLSSTAIPIPEGGCP